MSTLTLRIPDDLKQQLDALSRQQPRPAGELERESLRRYLAQEELRLMRERCAPHAEAWGFVTDEDVFRVVSCGSSWTPTCPRVHSAVTRVYCWPSVTSQ
ncbi:MAG TPA: ribbon-helix-helix domain-containing protein [Lacipirellulaceae bacterium]|nr:ribbon-helix-helix domain-containing protein [Lacipirellulaceae bacterium]